MTGVSHGLFGDSDAAIKAMADAVNEAETRVHSEFFITAWDDTTDVFCTALAEAVKRGVRSGCSTTTSHLGRIRGSRR